MTSLNDRQHCALCPYLGESEVRTGQDGDGCKSTWASKRVLRKGWCHGGSAHLYIQSVTKPQFALAWQANVQPFKWHLRSKCNVQHIWLMLFVEQETKTDGLLLGADFEPVVSWYFCNGAGTEHRTRTGFIKYSQAVVKKVSQVETFSLKPAKSRAKKIWCSSSVRQGVPLNSLTKLDPRKASV